MNEAVKDMLGTIIRKAMTILGSFMVAHDIWTPDESQRFGAWAVAAGALAIGTLPWSLWKDWFKNQLLNTAAATPEKKSVEEIKEMVTDPDKASASAFVSSSVVPKLTKLVLLFFCLSGVLAPIVVTQTGCAIFNPQGATPKGTREQAIYALQENETKVLAEINKIHDEMPDLFTSEDARFLNMATKEFADNLALAKAANEVTDLETYEGKMKLAKQAVNKLLDFRLNQLQKKTEKQKLR